MCASRAQAEQARRRAAAVLGTLGLRLHPGKTTIVCLAGGEQGFDFLGFHHRKVESWKHRGRFYLQRWPKDAAMAAIRAKIRERTSPRYVGWPLKDVVGDLNPVLRGWGNYFRNGNSARKFAAVDGYVHERIAILASRKYGLRGRNWKHRFNTTWFRSLNPRPYQLSGTIRYRSAHA